MPKPKPRPQADPAPRRAPRPRKAARPPAPALIPGRELADRRLALGRSQNQAALRIGLTVQTIRNIELDRSASLESLGAYCRDLGLERIELHWGEPHAGK